MEMESVLALELKFGQNGKEDNMKILKIKSRLKRNFFIGMMIGLILLVSALFAVSITGTFNTFSSGGVMKSADINANFATLKAAIEGIPAQKSWRLIYENDISATTNSILVNDLDGNSFSEFMIITKFVSPTISAGNYAIEINGDTACNYYNQVMYVGAGSANVNNAGTATCSAEGLTLAGSFSQPLVVNSVYVSKLILNTKTGIRRQGNITNAKVVSALEAVHYIGQVWWENSASNITSMRFYFTSGNGIASGSRIEIWGIK